MGMAASQARFLGLTARMNNIEYEGQQINQQRTALSNKSASYYSDLLGMSVPTAPSVEEYTQTVYTFNDGALTNQITSLIADTTKPGTYKVSYIKNWTDDFSIVAASPSIITKNDAGTEFKIGATKLCQLVNLKQANGTDREPTTTEYAEGARDDDYWKSLSPDQRKNLLKEESAYLNLLRDTYGADANFYVRYVQNTSTGEYEAIFYNEKDIKPKPVGENGGPVYDERNNTQSFVAAYKVGSAQRVEEIKGVEGCYLEQDSTGRYINIKIDGKTYALSTNTITDQDAYEDAMNQYEYDKALYDQSIEEINAKIEIIQAEDKNLELRLKQLDTEHNAVSNEKDAVEKVIEKAVEGGFKTFG
ncbi:MAG: hypothetical protein NC390_05130 [Fusobacterium sp.]|nr:hypothetical protein [Fusobacterium sp.]